MDAQPPKVTWMIGPFDGSFAGPFPLSAGDLLLHFSSESGGLSQSGIGDLWQMCSAAQLWCADRKELMPPGFQLHHSELGGSNGGTGSGDVMHFPNLWRVRAGDRLALIGERLHADSGMCYIILEFQKSALVYWLREDGTMPMPEEALSASPSPDDAKRLVWTKRAVSKVAALGPPKIRVKDWCIG